MILVGFSWVDVLLGILYVSLAVLIIVIAYRKLLAYLGKGTPVKADYLVLYTIEYDQNKGEYTFYFTSEKEKEFRLELLDADMNTITIIREGSCSPGGNIVRHAASAIPSEAVFYCLSSDNQRTMKKFK